MICVSSLRSSFLCIFVSLHDLLMLTLSPPTMLYIPSNVCYMHSPSSLGKYVARKTSPRHIQKLPFSLLSMPALSSCIR